MPIALIIFMLIVLFAILAVTSFCWTNGIIFSKLSIISIVCVVAICTWMKVAWPQKRSIEQYFPIQSSCSKITQGQIQFVDIDPGYWDSEKINITSETKCFFPENSYAKFYKKNPYNRGINWRNGDNWNFDCVIKPDSPEYEKVKSLAKK